MISDYFSSIDTILFDTQYVGCPDGIRMLTLLNTFPHVAHLQQTTLKTFSKQYGNSQLYSTAIFGTASCCSPGEGNTIQEGQYGAD